MAEPTPADTYRSQHRSSLPVRVISHNIRFDANPTSPGEAPWKRRLPPLAASLFYHSRHVPTILCLQEALHHQILDVQATLNGLERPGTPWQYLGRGRDDGQHKGEACAILFRSDAFAVQQCSTVWLSEQPATPGSKGWDAASVRVCTVALLRSVASAREVVVLNTHLDDQGEISRRESAKMVVGLVHKWSRTQNAGDWRPVVVAADLNSEEAGEAYRIMTRKCGLLRDAKYLCRVGARYGERYTYTGFEGKRDDTQTLDYVFVGPAAKGDEVPWDVSTTAVLPNELDGLLHSDHRAVVADLLLR